MGKSVDILRGTLDLLILKAVSLGPQHGDEVLLRIEQLAKGRLQIEQGSLYPALHRLEHKGYIESEWGESDNRRKAKFYSSTAAGKRQLRNRDGGVEIVWRSDGHGAARGSGGSMEILRQLRSFASALLHRGRWMRSSGVRSTFTSALTLKI